MNIFNSLGSNYSFEFVLKALFATNDKAAQKKLVQFLEEKYKGKAVLLYKGREAIELALKIADLPKKSLVVINGYTCYVVYKAIENIELTPLLLDIQKEDLNFSSVDFEAQIKKKEISAVIVQNTLGYPCDIENIEKLCKKHGVILIEDLAHSVGTVYENGKEAGTVGDFTVLSFSQDKMLDGISGGALVIRSEKFKEYIQKLPEIGFKTQLIDRWYPKHTYFIRLFYPYGFGKLLHALYRKLHVLSKPLEGSVSKTIRTIPSWYSQLILFQWKKLGENILHRRKIATVYGNNLDKDVMYESVIKKISHSTNLRFPIFIKHRDRLISYLKKRGVYVSDIWFDAPIAPKKYMRFVQFRNNCPHAEDVSEAILNLPTHRYVSEKDATKISEYVNEWYRKST